jgi:dipeptidyl aminopeptidase/acylaminoacyl peptidase
MRAWLLAAAVLVMLAVVGCGGGYDAEINPKGSGGAITKWGSPAGNQDPKGVVMLLHGGGWQPSRTAFESEFPTAQGLQQAGLATVVVGYDEGATGFQEIEHVYSKARQRYPDLPICVHGISAGANLGLMLAAREPDLSCVLAIAAPTDLTTLKDQGGTEAYDLAKAAFGEDQLAKFSPVRYADQIDAKVLLLNGESDPIVPVAQAQEFVRARPETQVDIIPNGSTPLQFLHGATVDATAGRAALLRGYEFIVDSLNG